MRISYAHDEHVSHIGTRKVSTEIKLMGLNVKANLKLSDDGASQFFDKYNEQSALFQFLLQTVSFQKFTLLSSADEEMI
jgi:hypothetical protein